MLPRTDCNRINFPPRDKQLLCHPSILFETLSITGSQNAILLGFPPNGNPR
ncbi:hypothetical protein LguiA_008486 [Lonicera macranthoides]